MIVLSSLFRPADLDAAIAAGHVRAQDHPSLPRKILNYTERAPTCGPGPTSRGAPEARSGTGDTVTEARLVAIVEALTLLNPG